MKHSILILAVLFFISSCGGGSICNNDTDGLITENATVYYDVYVKITSTSIEYIPSYCYLIETESNKVFIPKTSQSLSKLNLKPNSNSKVKITYRLTGDKLPTDDAGCNHVGRFPTAVIEVICIDIISRLKIDGSI